MVRMFHFVRTFLNPSILAFSGLFLLPSTSGTAVVD